MNRALLISGGIGCGVLCSYCPQSTIGRAYKRVGGGPARMSMDVFRACVDKLPSDVTVDFTGFYEPFLNPSTTDMILYASSLVLDVRLSTTVMGLNPQEVDRIAHVPFTKFAVHLPDTKGLTRIIVDDKYLASLDRLTSAKISNIAFHVHEGADGPEDVHETVNRLLQAKGIEPENRWINTRAGNVDVEGKEARKRLEGELDMCPRIYQQTLLPSGEVALCCMDWDLKHVIGNLLECDYEDLFETPEFKRVIAGYSDDSIDILCRTCEVARTKKDVIREQFITETSRKFAKAEGQRA